MGHYGGNDVIVFLLHSHISSLVSRKCIFGCLSVWSSSCCLVRSSHAKTINNNNTKTTITATKRATSNKQTNLINTVRRMVYRSGGGNLCLRVINDRFVLVILKWYKLDLCYWKIRRSSINIILVVFVKMFWYYFFYKNQLFLIYMQGLLPKIFIFNV